MIRTTTSTTPALPTTMRRIPQWSARHSVQVVLVAVVLGMMTVMSSAPALADHIPLSAQAYGNGRLPGSELEPVAGVRLTPPAAEALADMIRAAARGGSTLAITDGYRTYEQQILLKERKGWLAATPGTSQHGWGVAVDFDMRVTDFAWLREHAAAYGWIHPEWARAGGSKPEPWHWEFVGRDVAPARAQQAPPTDSPPPRPETGEVIASARLEPVDGPVGSWFEIHEGLEDLETGPGHYPGTALAGQPGNFAVAGYQHDHGAHLRGLDELVVGDRIRVRDSDSDGDVDDDEADLYEVIDRALLTHDDVWALDADPLQDGSPMVMTLTTAAAEGLTVVWAVPAEADCQSSASTATTSSSRSKACQVTVTRS